MKYLLPRFNSKGLKIMKKIVTISLQDSIKESEEN